MKYILIVLLAFFSLTVSAQNVDNEENQIRDNAQQFLKALISEKYDEAKKLGTEETNMMIEQIKMFTSMVPDSLKPEMKAARAKAMKAELTFGDIEFLTESTCSLKFTSSEEPDKEETIGFRKIENKWLVDLSIGFEEETTEELIIEEDLVPKMDE